MERSMEKLEIYQKNLQSLQEAAEELMRRMKGHDYSFRKDITDKRGTFCSEKLHGLVEEMLSIWEENLLHSNRFIKNEATSYLEVRRELYGLYLCLVMRCSLYRRGYFCARGSECRERTDFAFLLEQAKWFSRSWCITDGPDGNSQNEPRWGYDAHFGFHLYSPINHYLTFKDLNVRTLDDDWALTPPHLMAENRCCSRADEPEDTDEPEDADEPEDTDGPDMDDEDLFCEAGDREEEVDDFGFGDDDFWSALDELDEEDLAALWEAEYGQQGELEERNMELLLLVESFEGMEDYCSACRRFAELFQAAGAEIARDFCRELEEIVNLYLAQREIAPLADTDKAMDVYSRLCEGALRQARRYGRELQWKDL